MTQTQVLVVTGMSCEHCERTVEKALLRVPGVQSVKADHRAGRATVTGDADPQVLRDAVATAGYRAG